MMRVYSIFDRQQFEYGSLVQARNDEVVRRMALDTARQNQGSLMALHPEDFDILVLGSFNTETGELCGETPRLVANLGDIVRASAGGVNGSDR